jgi:hypothetical protein
MVPRRRVSPERRSGPPVVKTTVHLPTALWQRAKLAAVRDRKDLRDLIIEGLRLVLRRRRQGD